MIWADVYDELQCREIIGVDVFTRTKKGTSQRSAKWAKVVENLSNVEALYFKVDKRAVQDRYNLLSCNLRRKMKKEVRESRLDVEVSEVEKALEWILEKDAAEQLRQEGKSKKLTTEVDRRRQAMESLGETQNRKSVEIESKPGNKR